MGKVQAVCISLKKGTPKRDIKKAKFIAEYGIENDAHAGAWHRQVSMLSFDKIEEFRQKGADVEFGDFGENLVVADFDFATFPIGTIFSCGDVVLEMTQIGKDCHRCHIYEKMGECIMPTQGVFARVLQGGEICVGDEMSVSQEKNNDDK